MNKELFKQFFVIAYMASKSERLPHRKNETVEIQADRYAEVCWIKFCQIWPVKETSYAKTATLIIMSAIVSFGLNPGGCGFSSFSGNMN